MSSLFDRLRGQGADKSPRSRGRYRPRDWAEDFAHPAPRGHFVVQVDTEPWRVVDDRGAVWLLVDNGASLRAPNGDRLLSLAPDIAGSIVPRTSSGLVEGLAEFALGAAIGDNPQTGMPMGGYGGAQMNSWLIKEFAGLVIARVEPQKAGSLIELLPTGALNNKIVRRRFSPELAAKIRAMGPLTSAIVEGSPINGVGQVRGPAGELVATERFAYREPVTRSGTLRRDLGAWTIDVDNNPFPLAWVVAVLRSTKVV